jgi:hypothetical protein
MNVVGNEKMDLRHQGAKATTTGHRVENVREVLILRFGNMTYDQYCRICVLRGTAPLSKNTVEEISTFFWQACERVGRRLNRANLDYCIERGGIVLVADAGWTKRGWISQQGWDPVMDFAAKRLVHVIAHTMDRSQRMKDASYKLIFKGSYAGSLGGMEASALV